MLIINSLKNLTLDIISRNERRSDIATSLDYIEYVTSLAADCGDVRYKKMFGEYMVYINNKPILLVCDNTVYVKILPCLDELMLGSDKGFPYNGAKEHYILDIDNAELVTAAVNALEAITPVPVPKKKKGQA